MQDVKERRDEDLLVLPTDAVLFEDSSFKVSEGSHVAGNCTSL
jgi:L-ascorbate peroxidase